MTLPCHTGLGKLPANSSSDGLWPTPMSVLTKARDQVIGIAITQNNFPPRILLFQASNSKKRTGSCSINTTECIGGSISIAIRALPGVVISSGSANSAQEAALQVAPPFSFPSLQMHRHRRRRIAHCGVQLRTPADTAANTEVFSRCQAHQIRVLPFSTLPILVRIETENERNV
jgi:hypothetical protein